MISARLRASALLDTNTGEITAIPSGVTVLKAGDVIAMADGGNIPEDLLDGVAHQAALCSTGTRHRIKRFAKPEPETDPLEVEPEPEKPRRRRSR